MKLKNSSLTGPSAGVAVERGGTSARAFSAGSIWLLDDGLEKYKTLFDNVKDLAYVCDIHGNVLYLNRVFEKLTGHSPEEFIGKSFAPLFEEGELRKAEKFFARTLRGESPLFEVSFKKTGILCEYKNVPLKDEKGDVIGVMGTARDISERRKNEDEILRRAAILDSISLASEELANATFLDEAFGRILEKLGKAVAVSRVYVFEKHRGPGGDLLVTLRHEWTAAGIRQMMTDDRLKGFSLKTKGFDRWLEKMPMGEIIQGHVKDFPGLVNDVLSSYGVESFINVPIFVDKEWWGFIGFDECKVERDWSAAEKSVLKAAASTLGESIQRRAIEDHLRKIAKQFAEAQRIARIGSWEWDIEKNCCFWSEEMCRIFGFEMGGMYDNTYERFLDSIHPGDRRSVARVLEKSLETGEPFEVEYRIIRPDGKIRNILSGGEIVCDMTGRSIKIIGATQDITDRKQAEKGFRESEHNFKTIFEDASEGMVIVDIETNKPYMANRKFREMLGYSPEDLRALSAADFHPEEDLSLVMEKFEKAKLGEVSCSKNIPMKRKDGSVFYADMGNAIIKLGGKRCIMGFFWEVPDQRGIEDEFSRYSGNLEAIFHSLKDAIITVDLDTVIVEVNEAAGKLCGITRSSIGKKYGSLAQRCGAKCLRAIKETIKSRKPVEITRLECHIGGRDTHTVALNTYPLIDNRRIFSGVVLVIRDETRIVDLERDLNERKQLHNIMGRGRKMQEVFQLIENLADIDTTVLITGESGTGKELVAEALHYTGIRADNPLVKVNCSALAEHLLESELFGHVKGAFTGAVCDRVGRFQMADGGTIFLDEIGDITPDVQLRLLRVLQEKEFERLGDSTTVKVDVRIIAATNKNLTEKVRQGEFREDLYYRLKVVELEIPPLRERLEDLPILEDHFINKFNRKFGRDVTALSADAQKIFMEYPWPGNVRELEHAIEHAFIVCRQHVIGLNHLPQSFRGHQKSRTWHMAPYVGDERASIIEALERSSWNKARAARLLGMSRRTIYRKIDKYRIAVKGRV